MPVLKSFTSIWGLSSVVVFEPLPQAAQDKRIHSTREKPRKNLLSFIKASPFKVLCFENRLAYFNIKRRFFQGDKKALRGGVLGGIACIVAVCGVGFGVYGMTQSSDLQKQ